MEKIKIGICGFGNLGKGVELAVSKNDDMELVGVFTRRDPKTLTPHFKETNFFHTKDAIKFKNDIDVMILCGGSATDMPIQGPQMAKIFNTVDSFDNHSYIPKYFEDMDKSAKENNNLSLISCGWDPGLFSLNRLLFESILPFGNNYVFYGKGVSQGHSDAIRRIKGVKNAIQYTVPYDKSIEKVRNGLNPKFESKKDLMWRECFVVLDENGDKNYVENEIKNMESYFRPYNTVVHFISEDELKEKHSKLSHGGFVLRSGKTSKDSNQITEFSLKLDSNPEFTASVLISYARAIYKMRKAGKTGSITILDIPISEISRKSKSELLKEIL